MVEMRRSMTLSDHMSTPVSSATRRSQTLRSAIASEAFASASSSSSGTSRTLMDIIREEHAISRGEFPLNPADNGVGGGVSWKGFKDRLRLRRTSAAWTDAAACGGAGAGGEPDDEEDGDLVIGFPTSPVFGRAIAARLNQAQMPGSLRERDPENIPAPSVQIISNSAESSSSTSSSGEEEGGAAEGEPERVSLMALLGQSDPENGMSEDEEDAEEVVMVEEEEKVGGGVHHVCCVCMVRHKGAAFIPCGHTFCRLCSRELWVSRGNCPLCNGYILEILDIF